MAYERHSYVYILGNWTGSVLYVGVTNDLKRRVYEHKTKLLPGFTLQYKVDRLLYYEAFGYIGDAILREKQLKGGSRRKKVLAINRLNPGWVDLYDRV